MEKLHKEALVQEIWIPKVHRIVKAQKWISLIQEPWVDQKTITLHKHKKRDPIADRKGMRLTQLRRRKIMKN